MNSFVAVDRTRLINSHLSPPMVLALNSQRTLIVVRPFGVYTSRHRVEDQMISLAECPDVVLHHQAAANDFDINGHALTFRRRR
jgi:hypothetical protein